MNRMAYVNVAEWNPDHVADWLRGLEDEIQPYTQFFVNNKINGCHLLTLCRDDLNNLNITKIGHQELVLEAVELLRQLHYNLTSETLQSLALKLGCKAQSLYNNLKRVCLDYENSGKKERIAVDTLSDVSDIINLVKSLISWLDRYPFVGQEKYVDVRKTILKLSVELASTAQRDQFAEMPHKIIKEICLNLASQSDKIVQEFNDSLIIQPASLEVGKIKRKVEDDLGIHINSLYTGIHIIEDVKFQSAAYRSGKVEEGDEIVQVNYQTVIGWQIKNIICSMKEHPSEVHLTLKKRPRHPNVLGQVITLWPYRIPSKKTALRKLYKWNKGKATVDIRDMCPKSPASRNEISSVSEASPVSLTDKEKLFAVNRPRGRLRRRATVTGISPTALQAPVSLEDLIGSNSKRKESVLRTVSYDPNKTVDLEDNVFKREIQGSAVQENIEVKPDIDGSGIKDKVADTYLRPPQEKYMLGSLRRQEALKNSETVPKPLGPKPSPLILSQGPPVKPPSRMAPQPDIAAPPPVPLSPKQKLADWMQKQKKKHEGSHFQHALSIFTQDSNSQGSNSKECGSPKSPKPNSGSPKVKKGSGNMFNFSLREGRPSLSELRSLKKTANSRVFSERVGSNQVENSVPSVPKQQPIHKRNQMPQRKPGSGCPKPIKDTKLEAEKSTEAWKHAQFTHSSKITDSYIHPKHINYSKIPQFPCEMHESKIVSLKTKANENEFPKPASKPGSNVNQHSIPANNVLHYQRARQMSKLNSGTLLHNTKKSGYPTAFYSPSGRSLSFNNIAMSSGDSSSEEEEYEIYEELDSQPIINGHQRYAPQPASRPEIDPQFARQVAEMYAMLSQRNNNYMQPPVNGNYRSQYNPPNSAVIDELALRMYHALQLSHMQQSQKNFQQAAPPLHHPIQNGPKKPPHTNIQFQGGNVNLASNSSNNPCPKIYPSQSVPQNYCNKDNKAYYDEQHNSVHERPVDLPPSYLPPRHINTGFKSATSQEIHNLYTSQVAAKTNGAINGEQYETEKSLDHVNGYADKDPMYESIPWSQQKMEPDSTTGKCNEVAFLCPAERDFDIEMPCRDHLQNVKFPKPIISDSNSHLKNMNNVVFYPIKEETTLKDHSDDFSAFKTVESKKKALRNCQMNGNVNIAFDDRNYEENSHSKLPSRNLEQDCNGRLPSNNYGVGHNSTSHQNNRQPTISSLMMNLPKPPSEDYSEIAVTKSSSSSQTDVEICHSKKAELKLDSSPKASFTLCPENDESFTSSLNNSSQNLANENSGYSSSTSLNSTSSGSAISSSGSCYYYVETQIRPQFTMKLPSVTSENGDDSLLIDLRSPTLPTMGVSMLSKKRSTSSSGSDRGSSPGSRSSPNVAAVVMSDGSVKSSAIVTDIEHTI